MQIRAILLNSTVINFLVFVSFPTKIGYQIDEMLFATSVPLSFCCTLSLVLTTFLNKYLILLIR